MSNKMISRRKLTKVLAGLPFVAPLLKTTDAPSNDLYKVSAAYHPGSPLGIAQSTMLGAAQSTMQAKEPLMSKSAAFKLLLNDKTVKDTMISALYQIHHRVEYIDPDLLALKSWSHMAKITFQRQRNVEKSLRDHINIESTPWHKIENIVNGLAHKIMWGEK